jgi:hypothetical protein
VAGILIHPPSAHATGSALDLSSVDSTVSLDASDRPLGEVLRTMAGKGLIEISGGTPGGEPLTQHFTSLTIDRALSRIMRGYNYVLIDQGKARAPLLKVMGKIEKVKPEASKAPADSAAAPDLRSYVPPAPPREIPIGKDGKPVPHWVDDEGRVRLIGEEAIPSNGDAAGAGQTAKSGEQQANGSSGQPPGTVSPGATANNQVGNAAPAGQKQESPQEATPAPPNQPPQPESSGDHF